MCAHKTQYTTNHTDIQIWILVWMELYISSNLVLFSWNYSIIIVIPEGSFVNMRHMLLLLTSGEFTSCFGEFVCEHGQFNEPREIYDYFDIIYKIIHYLISYHNYRDDEFGNFTANCIKTG